jgi:transposase
VVPVWDQQLGTLTWCIDQALRAAGGAPTYLLTDNARTVTMDHVAGIPVRHPEMVAMMPLSENPQVCSLEFPTWLTLRVSG